MKKANVTGAAMLGLMGTALTQTGPNYKNTPTTIPIKIGSEMVPIKRPIHLDRPNPNMAMAPPDM